VKTVKVSVITGIVRADMFNRHLPSRGWYY